MLHEILLAIALMQPCEFRTEACWWGFRAYVIGNTRGDVLRIVVWPQSVIVEIGKWNRLLISKTIW